MKIGSLARLAILACCALAVPPGAALAETVAITSGETPVTVDIPAGWKVSKIARGIQAKTADEEVYVWFESYAPASYAKVVAEHEAYFAKQGVTITGKGKSKTIEQERYSVKATNFPAEYEDKPTVLRYISVEPKDPLKKRILMSYWASPEGDKEHDAAMDKIIESLGGSVDAQQ